MAKKISATIFCLLLSCVSFSQQLFTCKGTIRSSEGNVPLAYVTIANINGSSQALSGTDGFFTISFLVNTSTDTLRFFILGFETKTLAINTVKNSGDTLQVYLTPKSIELPSAIIKGHSAVEIIKQCIHQIQHQFPTQTIDQPYFYRQYHAEKEKYVRLLEAKIQSPQKSYADFISDKNEKIKLCALRRSNFYEINKEKHGDHLMDILNEDPVKYTVGSVLNEKSLMNYTFHFVPEKCSENIMVIAFTAIKSYQGKFERGEIYVDENKSHILKMIIENFIDESNYDFRFNNNSTYTWKFNNSHFLIEYEAKDYGIRHIQKNYRHLLYNSKTHFLESIVDEYFDLIVCYESPALNCPPEWRKQSNLYNENYNYTPDEWLASPALDLNIKHDLELKENLEQQFSENSK